MEVRVVTVGERAVAAEAAAAAFARIAALEEVLSDWRPTSELRRLERAGVGAWQPVSAPLRDVLAIALDVARATDGAFDPTVGPLTALWRDARRTGRPVPPVAREAALRRVGHRFVELDSAGQRVRFLRDSMRLDLGAVAKGWILDRALETLRAAGVEAALVEAGGDLSAFGAPPGAPGWRVSVPRAEGDTVLVLRAGAVSTSGPDAQSIVGADGARESHVLMPTTGRGATDGRRVTVLGTNAATTDALATALSLVPPDAMRALAARYDVRIIAPAGDRSRSP